MAGRQHAVADEACWSGPVRTWLALVTAVCAVLLAVAYAGAEAQGSLDRQLAWLNLAVVASVVSASAHVLFLLHGRRRVRALQRVVLFSGGRYAGGPSAARPANLSVPSEPVTVVGTPWAHRPQCLLVVGKPTVGAAIGRDLAPCPVCRPAEADGA